MGKKLIEAFPVRDWNLDLAAIESDLEKIDALNRDIGDRIGAIANKKGWRKLFGDAISCSCDQPLRDLLVRFQSGLLEFVSSDQCLELDLCPDGGEFVQESQSIQIEVKGYFRTDFDCCFCFLSFEPSFA